MSQRFIWSAARSAQSQASLYRMAISSGPPSPPRVSTSTLYWLLSASIQRTHAKHAYKRFVMPGFPDYDPAAASNPTAFSSDAVNRDGGAAMSYWEDLINRRLGRRRYLSALGSAGVAATLL